MDEKRKFENGIHNIENDDYHSSMGVSRSALMEFKRSPFHYWHKHLSGNHDNSHSTSAMDLGNLIHTMVLESHKFDEEFVIRPDLDRRTNAGKFAYNQFTSTLAGRTPIVAEQLAQATCIKQAVEDNEIASSLLADCLIEKSIYFTHVNTGIQCKVRPDAWSGSIVIDLKTTQDASYRNFQSSAFKYGYFLQAGMIYRALQSLDIQMEKFVILAVEKDTPYATALYVLDDEAIDFGCNQFDTLMQTYAQCLELDKWPGYGIQSLSVPGYAKFEIETEYEHE